MAKKHRPYAPEFRQQMIELVRAGRGPEELAKEFEPSAQAIRNWVAHAVVLAPVKERPGNVAASCTASVPAVRDSHSTRRRWQHAGRDEKMLSAEPKDHSKEEDRMPSNQIR